MLEPAYEIWPIPPRPRVRVVNVVDLAALPSWWSAWPVEGGWDLVCFVPVTTVADALRLVRRDLGVRLTLESANGDGIEFGRALVIRPAPGGEIRSLTFYTWR